MMLNNILASPSFQAWREGAPDIKALLLPRMAVRATAFFTLPPERWRSVCFLSPC